MHRRIKSRICMD